MEIAYIQLASIFLILISIGRESSVQTIRVSTRSPETEASRLKMIELLSRVGDGDVEKNRIPNTDQSADDKNELARLKREVSRLESIVQQLQHLCHGTSTDWKTNNEADDMCPQPEILFPPRCCSFPFTLDGQLHYRCVPRNNGPAGCFADDRIWVRCTEPNDFVVFNHTGFMRHDVAGEFETAFVHNWVMFQQRIDRTSFAQTNNQTWEEFKVGFGSPDGNFWLGLEKVHKMTNNAPYKLRIEFKLENNSWYSAEYDTFRVESESQYYRIHVGGYSGDFDDVLNNGNRNGVGVINGMNFSTIDRDNDRGSENDCSANWGGGWWYNNCCNFNPNGVNTDEGSNIYYNGEWVNMLSSRMMLKRKI